MSQACNLKLRISWSSESKVLLKSIKIDPIYFTLPLSMNSFHLTLRYTDNDFEDRPFLQAHLYWSCSKTYFKCGSKDSHMTNSVILLGILQSRRPRGAFPLLPEKCPGRGWESVALLRVDSFCNLLLHHFKKV